jgi:general secretion pathway protein D
MKLTRRTKLMQVALAGLMAHSTLAPLLISSKAHAQNGNDELDRLFEEEEFDEPQGSFNNAPPAPPAPPADFGAAPADPSAAAQTGSFDAQPPSSFGSAPATGGGRSRAGRAGQKAKANMANAQIEDITNENYPDLIESFDYPNAEITDITKAISQLTGKNFIIDPGVRGKISIIAPTQISVAEAYKAFLSALAINGFTVVPSGKFLKVKSARNAQRDSIETYSGQYYPNADLMITRIIHLKHISAEEVNKRLRILPSKDGEMTPYEPTNSLIISDYGANIERIMKIINDLDKPGFEEQLQVVQIRYSKSKDMADLINQIINKDTTKGGNSGGAPAFGAGVPRFRSRGGSAAGGTPEELSLVASDDRTNAIIVVGNNAGIQKVRDLVKKLDYKLDPSEAGGVFVYYVKYGEAEKIVSTLQGLAGGSAPAASAPAAGGFGAPNRLATPLATQAVFGGDVKFAFDKNTNSIVTTASKQDYETVQSLLSKLDIPRDQVFVEGIIMEMNDQKSRDWNPTVYKLDSSGARIGYSRQGTLANIINPASDSGTILGFGSGSVSININGVATQLPSLLAFIQAIQTNLESNILSTPKILALDNEESSIEVGDDIPVSQTSTSTAAGITSSVQREKASIKLVMTPYIRPDSDAVRMKITELSVKQPTTSQAISAQLAATNVVISDRTIKTNIVVNNGDTAVLGGLIRDEENVDETKVPILGDIPILGWLFKSSKIAKRKINLVVFLTPKIVRNKKQSHELLNTQTGERIDWIKQNFSGRDPYGKKIDSFPRAAESDMADEAIEPISSKSKSNSKRRPQSVDGHRPKNMKQ